MKPFVHYWKSFFILFILMMFSSVGLAFQNVEGLAEWPSSTPVVQLFEIYQGGQRSHDIASVRRATYELSDGSVKRFDSWYRPSWVNMRVSWIANMNANWGLIWGITTGERAPKYTIYPGVIVGATYRYALSSSSYFNFQLQSVLAGEIREKSCIANYGEIGGIQPVNCRLASTQLPPEETLQYLMNKDSGERIKIYIKYEKSF